MAAEVKAHLDSARLANWLFYNYRKQNTPVHSSDRIAVQLARARADVDFYGRGFNFIPPTTRSNVFEPIAVQKARPTYAAAPPMVNLLYSVPSAIRTNRQQQERIHELTQYFDSQAPTWVPQKILARGGQGMAVHYKYDDGTDDHDIVVKLSLNGNDLESILAERRATYRQNRAAHSIQMYDAPGLAAKPRFLPEPFDCDSSDDELTDYDSDGTGDPRPRVERAPRAQWKKAYRNQRSRAYIRRKNAYDTWYTAYAAGAEHDDFMLLEYMENGSLAGLMKRRLERNDQDNPPPNRVLWAFWLCLVRGVVGLEYPPNKFDATRKRIRPLENQYDPDRRPGKRRRSRRGITLLPSTPILQENAGGNSMMRDIKNSGFTLWTRQEFQDADVRFNRFGADLIEEVPTNPVAARLGESVVHFDIDPNNVLIDGFELGGDGVRDWQTRLQGLVNTTSKRPVGPTSGLPWKEPQERRVAGEHALIPRLKLADFGLAQRIKSNKRNQYYQSFRLDGKQRILAPEQFGADWESIANNKEVNGDAVGLDPVAGSYSHKTNVWQIALVMFTMITMYSPPMPPYPVPPAGFEHFPRNQVDDALRNANYTGPISYCPLLCDGIHNNQQDNYPSVDQDLRRTIYRCMYHRPSDRPNLDVLLREAKAKVNASFPGEDDNMVGDWVKDWFYNAPPNVPVPGGGGGGAGGGTPAGAPPAGGNPYPLQNEIRYNARFPYGHDEIAITGTPAQSGLEAMIESLRIQLPGSGVKNAAASMPTVKELQDIVQDSEDDGLFDNMADAGTVANGNYGAEQLAIVLMIWAIGKDVNTENNLAGPQLTIVMPNRHILIPLPDPNSYAIYIFNDNSGANNNGGSHVPQNDRYRGMEPADPPSSDDSNLTLSDDDDELSI